MKNTTVNDVHTPDEVKKLLLDKTLSQDARITLKFLLLAEKDREYVESCVDEFLASLDVQERPDLEGK